MTPNTFKMKRTPSFGSANAEAGRDRPCLWALFVAVCAGTMLATPGTTFAQSEVTKVLASDAAARDLFGFTASITGDTAIVGAVLDDHGVLTNAGSAYIYERDEGGLDLWGQIKILRPADLDDGDQFGRVSIDGDTAVVGAPLQKDLGDATGAIYIFYRDDGGADNWGQVKKIVGPDDHTRFGASVAISGDLMIVGTPGTTSVASKGEARIYERNEGGTDNWGEVAAFSASDGTLFDFFGESVDISDNGAIAIVGRFLDDLGGGDRGAAYIFEPDVAGDWSQTTKLTASDGVDLDWFGWSVSISGKNALVGAPKNNSDPGAAYVFNEDYVGAGNWGEIKKITPSDPGVADEFGWSVSIRGEGAVVGAIGRNSFTGALYVFDRNEGGANNWGQIGSALTASDAATGDDFGWSVMLDGDLAVIGAFLNDDNGTDSGSAYVFDGVCPCPWDIDGDGAVGVMDLLIFLGTWGPCADCGDCPADFDGDCDVGVIDLLTLLVSWGNCPCEEGTPPLSLEDELADACLTMDDWDDFVDVMTDPESSQADKDRYNC